MNLFNLRKMLAILELQSLMDRNNLNSLKIVKRLIGKSIRGNVFTEKEKRMYEEILSEKKQSKNQSAESEFQSFEYEGEVKNGAE